MDLDNDSIEEFKRLWKEEFGEERSAVSTLFIALTPGGIVSEEDRNRKDLSSRM